MHLSKNPMCQCGEVNNMGHSVKDHKGRPFVVVTGIGIVTSVGEGKEDNWIQTMPGKGWFTILRIYNPLEAFFDKSWKVGEIEPQG